MFNYVPDAPLALGQAPTIGQPVIGVAHIIKHT